MSGWSIPLLSLLVTLPGTTAVCPALAPLRSPRVLSEFNPARLEGLWYEWAFEDVAQVGATCQTLNATYHPATGVIDMAFAVHYKAIPFTIVEIYTPINETRPAATTTTTDNTTAVYIKRVNAPGSKLAELPSVFVDVTANSTSALTPYDTMSIFSCTTKLGISVHEVIFAGRSPTPPAGVLDQMEAVAKAQGVQWKTLTPVAPCTV